MMPYFVCGVLLAMSINHLVNQTWGPEAVDFMCLLKSFINMICHPKTYYSQQFKHLDT